jgi:integrase
VLPSFVYRHREYLTLNEVRRLRRFALKSDPDPSIALRNETLILFAYRFGMETSELSELRWSDYVAGGRFNSTVTIRRRKFDNRGSGHPTTHLLSCDEVDRFRKLAHNFDSRYVLSHEGGSKVHKRTIERIIHTIGEKSGLSRALTCEWLRDSCAHYLEQRYGQTMVANFFGIVQDGITEYSGVGFLQERQDLV